MQIFHIKVEGGCNIEVSLHSEILLREMLAVKRHGELAPKLKINKTSYLERADSLMFVAVGDICDA